MVEKLVYPLQWNEVWTKYPHGLTIFEAVVDWVNKVNDLVDLTNSTQQNVFEFYDSIVSEIAKLYTDILPNNIEQILDEWYDNGKLATLINLDILGAFNAKFSDIATIYASDYDVKADGLTDDTQALLNAFNAAVIKLPCVVRLPKGTMLYTDLGNLAYEGLTIEGVGSAATILKCISLSVNHNAIYLNAFKNDLPNDQFVHKCNLKNLQIQGNQNTDSIIYAQGIVGSNWDNVVANSANGYTGKAFQFRSVHTSVFVNVNSSINQGVNNPIPYKGLYVTEGSRGGSLAGNSTNNTFINCYFESVAIGVHLEKADQFTFISGAHEACTDTGLIIDSGSKWCTFMGVGYENNTNFEIVDNGRSNQFINIYAQHRVKLSGQQAKVVGGYFGSIEVIGTANVIEDVRVNRNGIEEGGLLDTGIGTYWKNIYDSNAAVNDYIFPLKTRAGISVGASPYTWQNTTGHYVQIIGQTGTLTAVQGSRAGGSSWVLPASIPNTWLVAPNDSITFSYTGGAPGLSYLTINGL